jgi:hypothetical protein
MNILMYNVDIIVSRFNENLDWINEYPFNRFKYIVYNKGDNDHFEKSNVIKIINIQNIGKNDHTYLYHIITNYDTLSNILVFFPGSININYKKEKAVQILNKILQTNNTEAYFIGYYQKSIKDSFCDFQLDKWKTSDNDNYKKNNESNLQLAKIRPYGLWYKYFFGNIEAHWSTWWGIFSIDKRDIIQHPITRYQYLIQTVDKHSNPEAGHYIERSWGAIFFPLIYTKKISC